jgi:hypothetical protein
MASAQIDTVKENIRYLVITNSFKILQKYFFAVRELTIVTPLNLTTYQVKIDSFPTDIPESMVAIRRLQALFRCDLVAADPPSEFLLIGTDRVEEVIAESLKSVDPDLDIVGFIGPYEIQHMIESLGYKTVDLGTLPIQPPLDDEYQKKVCGSHSIDIIKKPKRIPTGLYPLCTEARSHAIQQHLGIWEKESRKQQEYVESLLGRPEYVDKIENPYFHGMTIDAGNLDKWMKKSAVEGDVEHLNGFMDWFGDFNFADMMEVRVLLFKSGLYERVPPHYRFVFEPESYRGMCEPPL